MTVANELAAHPDVVAVPRLETDEHRYRSVGFFRDPTTKAASLEP